MSRESVALALFNKIYAPMLAAGAVTVSRRLRHWNDVTEQPAVFVAQGNQIPRQSAAGSPVVWTWQFNVYIYALETDQSASPATKLNTLIDALESALAPVGNERKQTLGGTVQHCWIEGNLETDEGVLGDQCVAIVPINILL